MGKLASYLNEIYGGTGQLTLVFMLNNGIHRLEQGAK